MEIHLVEFRFVESWAHNPVRTTNEGPVGSEAGVYEAPSYEGSLPTLRRSKSLSSNSSFVQIDSKLIYLLPTF
jgi:hypothetical protein